MRHGGTLPVAVPAAARGTLRAMGKAHGIEWKVTGDAIQAAVVTLPPGQGVVGEAGAMLFAGDGVRLETGLTTRGDAPSLVASVAEAIKRRIAGDTLFVTRFMNEGAKAAEVGFAAPFPGSIMRIDLDRHPDGVILQRDSFLCGSLGTEVTVAFQRNILAGLFGGEGFVLQRIRPGGPGCTVLAHAGGSLVERTLGAGESLRIDAGCVVAYEPTVNFDVQVVGNLPTLVFGGKGVFFATLTGPGRVWMQTMPFPRLAARIWDAAPQHRELPKEQREATEAAVAAKVKAEARG